MGLTTDTLFDVRVMQGCLVLISSEPAVLPEPEIVQTLRKVCKLSVRKQRQEAELIEVISRTQPLTGN